jgi:hypothetical protein
MQMAQNTPKSGDIVMNFIWRNSYPRGGNCSDCRLHPLCCCQFDDQHHTPDKAAGALGLVAVGALVGAVVGIGIYVYVK